MIHTFVNINDMTIIFFIIIFFGLFIAFAHSLYICIVHVNILYINIDDTIITTFLHGIQFDNLTNFIRLHLFLI